ncbi:MAG: transposase [Dehalococcoidia bacterium]
MVTNRQEIFHDDEDNIRLLETLDRYREKNKVKVYGWCLMGNHAHLLIEEGNEDISITIKRINISYAWFYNWKYNTIGHLFQDRYRSENIEDNQYIMTVIRYIHQNPVKAGILKKAGEWKWSSYQGYCGNPCYPQGLLDPEFILRMISDNKEKAIKPFIEYHEQANEDKCLDEITRNNLTDKEAREEIKKYSGYEITQIKGLPREQRNKALKRVKPYGNMSRSKDQNF